MSCSVTPSTRLYICDSEIGEDEDLTHEFKGHRNLSLEELPNFVRYDPSGKMTRQPLSKAICSFLNSLYGGTIYCGVTDTGSVMGMALLTAQREHFQLALDDLLGQRFSPAVPKSRYSVQFVPVQDSHSEDDVIYDLPCPDFAHVFRSWTFCACDKYAEGLFDSNRFLPKFVIEIHIYPPPEVAENCLLRERTIQELQEGNLRAWPQCKHPVVYCDETGCGYIRTHALDRKISEECLVQLSYARSAEFYQPIIEFYHTLTDQHKQSLPVNQ